MATNKNKILEEALVDIAKGLDWDQLAGDIMLLENCIGMTISSKQLKLLNQKLKVWEQEKQSRVSRTFDMTYFMSKDGGTF